MAQPPRFAARSKILTDLAVSEGARLLYLFLDDQSRGDRCVKVKRLRMAVQLGIGIREVTRRSQELETAGYLAVERTLRGNMYDLKRTTESHSDVTTESPRKGPPGHMHAEGVQETSSGTPTPYGETEEETPGPTCPVCQGRCVVSAVSRGMLVARTCGHCGGRGSVAA